MPIYEYRCPNRHVFELFQHIGDAPPEGCETCGEGPLERVLYPVAVHFKGSGFYSTDYGRGSRKQPKEGDSRPSSDSDSGGGEKEKVEKKAAEA
jgi:putative FmdB family regulatory protein